MEILSGTGVSPGVVIAQAFVLGDTTTHVARRSVPESDVAHQEQRLADAIAASVRELDELRQRVAREYDEDAARILEFHIVLLGDDHFIDPIIQRIRSEQVTAEYAVTQELRSMAERFMAMDSEAFRSKVSDLWDLDRRLLRHLAGESMDRLAQLDHEAVIVAHDLTPSQTAQLDTSKVRAFATEAGGRTSHTAIMARALGIPAVVGIGSGIEHVTEGQSLIIDGDRGLLLVDPDEDTLADYRRRITQRQSYVLGLKELAELPAETTDGVRINLLGNIEFAHEVDLVRANGGEGVGLFRSEFLYLATNREPSEEEHYAAYSEAVRLSRGAPLTIRTLDLGSDKYTQRQADVLERNPALGCRSIRYCLTHLSIFKRQLRAILRASSEGPVRVMFPLVTSYMELRQARMVLSDVMEDLAAEGTAFDEHLKVGIMIEAPSAAITVDTLVGEVDFLSIGTNDLIQYTLAVDRTNERVASLYSGAHPAVLRLIQHVVRISQKAGVETSLCGEMASDLEFVMLLLGQGLRTLSLVPTAIPDVKRVIRSVNMRECEEVARHVATLENDRKIQSYLREQLQRIIPAGIGGRSAEDE